MGNPSKPDTKLQINSEPFPGSGIFWEQRYASGGNSGLGSYNELAEFKAEIINAFVVKHDVTTVVEFGCGDGNQLEFANYPRYTGLDVSNTVITICKEKFSTDTSKTFKLIEEYDGEKADLSLSLDVIYHLVEDEVFVNYMRLMFKSAKRYTIFYASNIDEDDKYDGNHVRHRKFTDWIEKNAPDWKLLEFIANKYPHNPTDGSGSFADFYIYEKF